MATLWTAQQLIIKAGLPTNSTSYEFYDAQGQGFFTTDGGQSALGQDGSDFLKFQNELASFAFLQADPDQDFIFVRVAGGDWKNLILTANVVPPPPPPPSPAIGIVVADADKNEGNAGPTPFIFTVMKTGDLVGTYSATWTVSGTSVNGNQAANAADFTGGVFQTGTVTFGPGDNAPKTVTVNVNGDIAVEPNENFIVTLSNPTGGAIIDPLHPSAIGRIVNDDAVAVLAIAPAAAVKNEGNSGSTPFTFTVTRNNDITVASSATWTVSAGANPGANGDDFAGGAFPAGTVNFAVGETSKAVTVNVQGDLFIEPTENFVVTLSNPSGAVINPAQASASGQIVNDDVIPVLGIERYDSDRLEGNSGATAFTFTATRVGGINSTYSANWAVSGGFFPANGADFVGGAFPNGTVTFNPGEVRKNITINVAGDTTVEGNEDFFITLSNPTGGAVLDPSKTSALGIIINDDGPPVLSIAALSASKAEGSFSGTTPFTFLVTKAGDLSSATTVTWTVGPGLSPSADTFDFGGIINFPTGTVTLDPGIASMQITVPVLADGLVEPNEYFTMTLSNPTGGASIDPVLGSATGLIVNDDTSTPTTIYAISPLDASKAEGNTGQFPTFTFLVTRNGSTSSLATLSYSVSGSGAFNSADSADFPGGFQINQTVQFQSGAATAFIQFNVQGDTLIEPTESFMVTLAGVSGQLGQAFGTIINDDGPPQFGIYAADANKSEGSSGTTPFTFTVTRMDGDVSQPATVGWQVSGVQAGFPPGTTMANAGDFVGGNFPGGVVTFNPGETSHTIVVSVQGDLTLEADHGFAVTLANPNGGTIDPFHTLALGDILNDDFSLTPLPPVPNNDFNGDRMSDVLWQNDNGAVAMWQMNANQFTPLAVTSMPADWHIRALGDFNGDGNSDVLWQSDNGGVAIWQMNGNQFTPLGVTSMPANWHIRGLGDFNGDGKCDVLWQSDSGGVAIWQMNGNQFTPLGVTSMPADWHIRGIGDFNGDGNSDVLWQSDSGGVAIWQMNGNQFTPLGVTSMPADWHIRGLGDFNGDRKNDVLWQNDNGGVAEWQMNGNQFTGLGLASMPADWHIREIGDFNGDSKSDVLWQNDNGGTAEWQMNGNQFTGLGIAAMPSDWHIIG